MERSRFAVWGWCCTVTTGPHGKSLQVNGAGSHAEWFSVFNHTDWVAFEVSSVPPIAVVASGSEPYVGLVVGTATPLLHRCARLGFPDVGVPFLNRLLNTMPPNTLKKKPVTVIEKVFALILWLLPDFKDWHLVCESREQHTQGGKPLIGKHSTVADDVLDTSDKVELRKEHKKHEDQEFVFVSSLHCVSPLKCAQPSLCL